MLSNRVDGAKSARRNATIEKVRPRVDALVNKPGSSGWGGHARADLDKHRGHIGCTGDGTQTPIRGRPAWTQHGRGGGKAAS